MSGRAALPEAPRLRRLLERARPAAATAPSLLHAIGAGAQCDLCAAPLARDHRHLLELTHREVRCACQACAVLFDRQASRAGRFRRLPDRLWRLRDLALPEEDWRRLGVPVGTAFVYPSSATGGPVACYPSPLGLTESQPDAALWRRIVASHPALLTLEPDVEALLLHRRAGFEATWIASLETCFRLAACIREHWRGMNGGDRVWREIAREMDALWRRAVVVGREDVARRAPLAVSGSDARAGEPAHQEV